MDNGKQKCRICSRSDEVMLAREFCRLCSSWVYYHEFTATGSQVLNAAADIWHGPYAAIGGQRIGAEH